MIRAVLEQERRKPRAASREDAARMLGRLLPTTAPRALPPPELMRGKR